MADDASRELAEFFNYIWGEERVSKKATFVYLPVEFEEKWTKFMFEWPRQRDAVIRHVLKWSAIKANVFYSPALFSAANPQKENVLGSWVLWVDFDGNAPEDWPLRPTDGKVFVPPPTLIVQSSIPGHEHCYWKLSEFLTDTSVLEDRNRGLAYVMHADTSGWDADQILRPIRSINHKRNMPVTVKAWEK